MVTGARPFDGASAAAVTASILKSEPHPLPPALGVPPALQHLIATALEKDPERRWQTAHDLALQLRWINGSLSTEHAAAPAAHRRKRAAWLLLPLLLAGVAAIGWIAGRSGATQAEPDIPVRLRMPVAPAILLSNAASATFALSPEGQRVVWTGWETGQGVSALYLRGLGSSHAQAIAGTEDASCPFWSPDGKWIGFTSRGKLWKVPADRSGTPVAICDAGGSGTVAAWGDGFILFSERPGGRPEIYRVSEDGGVPSAVTKIRPGEYRHAWPQPVSGTNRFLYLGMQRGTVDRTLYVASFGSFEPQRLLEEASRVRVVGDRVYHVQRGTLVVQRADFAAVRFLDAPLKLADQVARFDGTGRADFDVSANRTIVYRTETSTGRLFLTDRNGRESRTLDDSGIFYGASFSPDGARIAAGLLMPTEGFPSIYLYDRHRAGRDRMTSDRALEMFPVWSPDGQSIAFGEAKGSPPTLARRLLAGGPTELLATSGHQRPGSFSRDGKTLYFTQFPMGRPSEILSLLLDGTKRVQPVVPASFGNSDPRVSPDGNWLAFSTNAPDGSAIYMMPLAGGEKIRISDNRGSRPRWSRSGDALFFMEDPPKVVMAKRGGSGPWKDATLTTLFDLPALRAVDAITAFDVSPSGDAFLIGETRAGDGDGDLHVILHAH